MATVTVNGITFDSDGDEFAGTAYVEGVIALAAALIADAGRAMATTSLSTYELGTGGGTVTMAEAVPFVAGAFFTLADQAAPGTNYAHCQVAARSGVSLTFTEIAVAGSGEKSAWNINLSGSQGAALLQGSATGALDMAGYRITVDRVTHEEGSEWKASATSSPAAVSGEQSAIVMRGGATRWIKIDGDTQQPVILPASGYTSAMRVIVEQGGAGARGVAQLVLFDNAVVQAPLFEVVPGEFTLLALQSGLIEAAGVIQGVRQCSRLLHFLARIAVCLQRNRAPCTRKGMSKNSKSLSGVAIATGAAIGSAAIAAALLYAGKRRKSADGKGEADRQLPPIPSGEDPQTD